MPEFWGLGLPPAFHISKATSKDIVEAARQIEGVVAVEMITVSGIESTMITSRVIDASRGPQMTAVYVPVGDSHMVISNEYVGEDEPQFQKEFFALLDSVVITEGE